MNLSELFSLLMLAFIRNTVNGFRFCHHEPRTEARDSRLLPEIRPSLGAASMRVGRLSHRNVSGAANWRFLHSKTPSLSRRHVRVRERETWDSFRNQQPSLVEDPPWRTAETSTSLNLGEVGFQTVRQFMHNLLNLLPFSPQAPSSSARFCRSLARSFRFLFRFRFVICLYFIVLH